MIKEILGRYYAKLFFKQWSIGILNDNIEDVIRNKKTDLTFKWLSKLQISQSYADPFIFISKNGEVNIFAEKFTTGLLNGEICLLSYDKSNGFSEPKVILNSGTHFSYPFIFYENEKMFVFIENAMDGHLFSYEFDESTKKLSNKKLVSELPLIDASILKRNNKYWLFGTLLGDGIDSKLNIYFSDNLHGPYIPHLQNPVKDNLNGSRPAGNFIFVDGEIYRPTQNSRNFYGESITINKIVKLTESEYEFEEYMHIKTQKNSEFNLGMHTINASGNFIVVDGQKGHFQPLKQFFRAFLKFFNTIKFTISMPQLIFLFE